MNAVVFHEHGGPGKLQYQEMPAPTLSQNEVLIRVKACALNHLDIWIRQGSPAYPMPLPHISGSDIAGVVEQIGSQVEGLVEGERVFVSPGVGCGRCEHCVAGRDNMCRSYGLIGAMCHGGYAEYVKVPARNVYPVPGTLTFEQAAAFPLVSVTAWHMLFSLADLRLGEDVLIMGAGSGVGHMAIQMAKLAGARVFTTVGSDDKIAKAKSLGADEVINHSREPVNQRVRELTHRRGVDVVIEHIGPDVWGQCIDSLAKGGRLVTCGATTGAEVKLDLRYVYSRQLTIKGSYMGSLSELLRAAQLIGQGRLRPVIDRTFPLADAKAAQEHLLSRKFFGKIVLAIP
ncbi:MAG: putative NAD-dependent alcohol dehydrogenase [Nitrospira sp.]|jgi:NADPH:quinone reductase-like Zn-dependent oxidoreductase|nr:putative NAD-dependent alcohol dehydrogenase [Nitrospira sp.]